MKRIENGILRIKKAGQTDRLLLNFFKHTETQKRKINLSYFLYLSMFELSSFSSTIE